MGVSKGNDCKLKIDKVDPFTNGIQKQAELPIGPRVWNYKIIMENNNETYYFGMIINNSGELRDIVETGTKMISLKLADGTVLDFTAQEDIKPNYNVWGTNIITFYTPKFTVERSVLEKLAASPITDLKLYLGKQEALIPDIKEKQTKKIVEAASCVLAK